MEFDKNLIKYIKPSVKLYIFTLISFVMLIALLCGYLYFNKLYDDKEPEKFTRESKIMHTHTLTFNTFLIGLMKTEVINIISHLIKKKTSI